MNKGAVRMTTHVSLGQRRFLTTLTTQSDTPILRRRGRDTRRTHWRHSEKRSTRRKHGHLPVAYIRRNHLSVYLPRGMRGIIAETAYFFCTFNSPLLASFRGLLRVIATVAWAGGGGDEMAGDFRGYLVYSIINIPSCPYYICVLHWIRQ